MMPVKLTIEDMEAAAQQLSKSGRGRDAMRGLLEWLERTGIGLDQFNQEAVLTLLAGVWGPFTMSARDAMYDALSGATVQQQ